ncbi:MAG: hypothetical protein M1821_007749 [Bathelium mastoideum]|nr:MAG: hypothetical protein M1821_007749 [Bathelium mastoideum]
MAYGPKDSDSTVCSVDVDGTPIDVHERSRTQDAPTTTLDDLPIDDQSTTRDVPTSAPNLNDASCSDAPHTDTREALATTSHDAAGILWKRWKKAIQQCFKYTVGPTMLVLAVVTLWPTIASKADGDASKALAIWTAKKDFLEYCADETQAAMNPDCMLARNMTLPPPPYFIDHIKRSLEPYVSRAFDRLASGSNTVLSVTVPATSLALVIVSSMAFFWRSRIYQSQSSENLTISTLPPNVHVENLVPKAETKYPTGLKKRKPVKKTTRKTYELMHDSWDSQKPLQQCQLIFYDGDLFSLAFGSAGQLPYQIHGGPRNVFACNLTWPQLNQIQLKLIFQRAQRYDMLGRSNASTYKFWARNHNEASEILERMTNLMGARESSPFFKTGPHTQAQMLFDPFYISSDSSEDEEVSMPTSAAIDGDISEGDTVSMSRKASNDSARWIDTGANSEIRSVPSFEAFPSLGLDGEAQQPGSQSSKPSSMFSVPRPTIKQSSDGNTENEGVGSVGSPPAWSVKMSYPEDGGGVTVSRSPIQDQAYAEHRRAFVRRAARKTRAVLTDPFRRRADKPAKPEKQKSRVWGIVNSVLQDGERLHYPDGT